jgi:predicted NBD/HSP70 family sugar kinase
MLITGDQQLLKQMNRMVLVRRLCREPELSRADLAAAVGLTKSTVSLLVRELVDEGWFSESDLVTTGSLGRRPTPLHIDKTRLALFGAEFGVDQARIVAINLVGEVIDRADVEYDDASDAAACFKQVAKSLIRLAKRVAVGGRSILGLGVGMHGGVDENSGILHYAPNLGWRDIDAPGLLKKHFLGSLLADVPLFVQNEADVAALAEFEFGDQSSVDPLVYLSIGHGVGAGVIVRDRLLTGYRGFAGEVGHTILQLDGPRCSCGRKGCADALIGFGALLSKLKHGGKVVPADALNALFAKAKAGNAETCEAVQFAGKYLGVLLNNVWVAFDPMRIVLGGAALQFGDTFLNPAIEVFNEFAAAAQLPAPTITLSRFGADAVAIGAAALVRYHLTRPYNLQAP